MDRVLNIESKPEWDEIEVVRKQVADFLVAHELLSDDVDAVSMVLCELMENAVKYGHYEGAIKLARVAVTLEGDSVIVEVKSPLESYDGEAMGRLDKMIQWIRGYQDPFQAYLDRLREVSSQSMDSNESGLGLVRIAYEGRSVLDFYVDETATLSINAVYTRESASGSGV